MGSKSPPTRSSSTTSFYTANDSDTQRSTEASSPTQGTTCPYREARQLPRELKEHCQIFLEEQLYTCAINLLNSTLASGLSRQAPRRKAAFIPPASHLAVLATLVVHPQHTTRADKPEHRIVSSLALDYLRNVLYVAGPINAGFRTAFQFHSAPRWSRRSGHTAPVSDSDMSDGESDRDVDRLRGRMANEASVWIRGQDLWSTIGWAFNTATLYPHRWRYWKVWLEFMLDLLDSDWAERESLDDEAYKAGGETGSKPVTAREQAMIRMYMEQQDVRGAGNKRMMKALFADGGSLSSSAFPEVFDKEPRGPRKTAKKRKRTQTLDLENDKFGDYFDDESMSSGISEPPTPEKRRDGRRDISFGSSNPGMAESIPLRLRFFRLISAATYALCRRSTLNQLYDDFAAAIKVLPLQHFALFVTQRENPLIEATHVTLTQELFHLLLPSKYKDPRKVDPEGDASGSLTMPMLQHCYAPWPANTVGLEDNAKLSLVIENALQLLWKCDVEGYSDSFAEAIKRGIEAREAKAKKKRTGKMRTEASDMLAQDVLAASGERIHALLELLQLSTSDADPST